VVGESGTLLTAVLLGPILWLLTGRVLWRSRPMAEPALPPPA